MKWRKEDEVRELWREERSALGGDRKTVRESERGSVNLPELYLLL